MKEIERFPFFLDASILKLRRFFICVLQLVIKEMISILVEI